MLVFYSGNAFWGKLHEDLYSLLTRVLSSS
jgi:hypothetical protein